MFETLNIYVCMECEATQHVTPDAALLVIWVFSCQCDTLAYAYVSCITEPALDNDNSENGTLGDHLRHP